MWIDRQTDRRTDRRADRHNEVNGHFFAILRTHLETADINSNAAFGVKFSN